MLPLKLSLSGKDSALISDLYRYHSGLSTLSLYRNPPGQLPGLDLVKGKIDIYQQGYEGGNTGNHSQVALRKKARQEVVGIFKAILLYLQSIATEDDIPALIQAGFSIRNAMGRKRNVIAPAAT